MSHMKINEIPEGAAVKIPLGPLALALINKGLPYVYERLKGSDDDGLTVITFHNDEQLQRELQALNDGDEHSLRGCFFIDEIMSF